MTLFAISMTCLKDRAVSSQPASSHGGVDVNENGAERHTIISIPKQLSNFFLFLLKLLNVNIYFFIEI
jgi:hypothetical protein